MIKKYLNNEYETGHGRLLGIFFGVFVLGSVAGFIYESIFQWANLSFKTFLWAGDGFGPWVLMYGISAVLMFAVLRYLKKQPWFVFLIGAAAGGIIQFVLGLGFYSLSGGERLWNYRLEILASLNLGGFVCLRSVIVFGILALLVIYVFAPLLHKMANAMKPWLFVLICAIVFAISVADMAYGVVKAIIV